MNAVSRIAVMLVAPLLMPALGAAQEGRSIFSALETAGRSVGPAPSVAQGTLGDADLLTSEGRRVQAWTLAGSRGDQLQIDLRSDAFDAYVYVVGPGLGAGITDDDGGEDLDSRICLAIDEPGEYRVVASSLSGETGAFTLEVRERVGATSGACEEEEEESEEYSDASELPTEGRTLRMGDDVQGTLDASDPNFLGQYADAWQVPGLAGRTISVDLISDDFDAYLELEGPGLDEVLSNDDGAGRCNARITVTFPEDGTYLLVATTLGTGQGAYRLIVREPGAYVDPTTCAEVRETATAVSVSADDVRAVGSIEVGGTRAGAMTDADDFFDDQFVQAWTLQASAGDRLAIENVSEDFDSYLHFVGPGFPDPLYDDDSAGSLDARICVEIPETATYRVLAGPFRDQHAGGRYTLRVRRDGIEDVCTSYEMTPAAIDRSLAGLPTDGRTIGVGQEREGDLDPNGLKHPSSNYTIQPWALELTAGREVSVDLVSATFDPLLYVVGPGLDEAIFVDDVGGGVCNSRVTFTPTASGTFRVLVGAYYAGGGGAFRLRVSTDAPEMEQGGCVQPAEAAAQADLLAGVPLTSSRTLAIGTEVEGTLDSDLTLSGGEPAQVWMTQVRAGEEIVFELLSEDFDCILIVDDGVAAPVRDDDTAGNLDSRVVYTATRNGNLRVVVSALSAGNSGTFRLRAIRRMP